MRKYSHGMATIGALLLAAVMARGDTTPVTGVQKLPEGVLLTCKPGRLQLKVYGEGTVRVTYAPGDTIPEKESFAVVASPSLNGKWTLRETDEAVTLETAVMRVNVEKASGRVGFYDLHGKTLLEEKAGGREFAPSKPLSPAPLPKSASGDWVGKDLLPADATTVRQSFVLPPEEAIYGLGQHQRGEWNYRGKALRLLQQNTMVGIPVIMSSRRYMLLWDNPSVTEVSVGAPASARGVPGAGEDVVRWTGEVGKMIDYYVCMGATPNESMKAYRSLTGSASMLPNWAWGFWHSKERYRSQAELLEVANEFRKQQIPIDGLIQDWRYWPDGTWGSHEFDKTRYPDPAGMFKELHALGYHALISVWPKFDVGTKNFEELEKAGALYPPVIPYVFPPGKGKWYDPMGATGRELYWKQVSEQLLPTGVDGWWLDAPEPELSGKWGEYRYMPTAAHGGAAGAEVFNAYPLMHSTGIYQGQRATTRDQKRVIILTRSAWAGQQRNGAVTWSGDIASTWQVFKAQVPAGLNFALSGIPYWNTDIGGFFSNGATGNQLPTDERYQELFTRWFQFGAFCPMFRVHGTGQNSGTGIGKEIYRFPEPTRAHLLTMLDLRYRLMPYIYSTAWQVTSNGSTLQRPLVMDFSGDPEALTVGNQFMFGPALLVNPVTARGAQSRDVYLPSTAGGWCDFWTGKSDTGGKSVDAEAGLDKLPLYVRAGSIVPMGPRLQHTGEKPADPIELRIYRGANGTFTLYEDQGDTYDYEKGAFATIPLAWNEATATLTLGQRKGTFPGMLKERTFRIVVVGEGKGTGVEPTANADREVHYSGAAVQVKLGV